MRTEYRKVATAPSAGTDFSTGVWSEMGKHNGNRGWQTAAAFASRAHRHQVRKDGHTPYFSHPCRVAMTVAVVFGCSDETALTAAFLHDTIEDTTTDFDDLCNDFGPQVAEIVASLTKNMALSEQAREDEYDSRLAKADWRARLIKLADQFDNVSDAIASGWSGDRLAKVLTKARRAMLMAQPDALHHSETSRAVDALQRVISDIDKGVSAA